MTMMKSIDLMMSILSCKSEQGLQSSLMEVTRHLGFESFVAGTQMVSIDGSLTHHLVSGYPEQWQSIYAERGYLQLDPTVAHCQKSTQPLIWSEEVFSDEGSISVFEEARSFGLSHGVSAAVHESNGTTKTMLSFARDRPIDEPSLGVQTVAKTIASCTHFVLAEIVRDHLPKPSAVQMHLTPQELNCLRWTSQGKTSWEVSRIMSLSEATVTFHLKNAMKKLGASNRPHALAIAVRTGIIN